MISGFFNEPTEKIIVSHYLVGYFFKWLYTNFSSTNWYPVLYFFIQVSGIAFTIHAVLNKLTSNSKIVFSFIITALFLPLSLNLQYTSVAYTCCISGIMNLSSFDFNLNKVTCVTELALFAKLPFRVLYPLVIGLYLMQLYFCHERLKIIKTKYLLAFTLIVSIPCISIILKQQQRNAPLRAECMKIMQFIKNNDQKYFIIRAGGKIPLEYLSMKIPPISYSSQNFLKSGWFIFSHPYETFLQENNIDNLLLRMIDNDQFIAMNPSQKELKSFIFKRYNLKIKFEKISIPPELKHIEALKNSFFIKR